MMKDMGERGRKKHENLIHEEFYEPRDKIPSVTANSDYKYKKMFEQYNKLHNDDNNFEPGYLEN